MTPENHYLDDSSFLDKIIADMVALNNHMKERQRSPPKQSTFKSTNIGIQVTDSWLDEGEEAEVMRDTTSSIEEVKQSSVNVKPYF